MRGYCMPGWNEILDEIEQCNRVDSLDAVRRKYLKRLEEITGRNVIAYYSGWLQKTGLDSTMINDDDKNGFMNAMYGLDRSKGLDIILHTPGGEIAATESIVSYLRNLFHDDIRAIIPMLSMSAGTMIACSCKEIIMGKQSSIGPIDPQYGGIPMHGILEEFENALKNAKDNPETIPIWQVIVSKYHPTFIGDCRKIIEWSGTMVKTWLETGMFKEYPNKKELANLVVDKLNDHDSTKSHAKHIDADEAKGIGLKIVSLEEELKDKGFQDCVLSIHHTYMLTFSKSSTYKIIENHNGRAYCSKIQDTTD